MATTTFDAESMALRLGLRGKDRVPSYYSVRFDFLVLSKEVFIDFH